MGRYHVRKSSFDDIYFERDGGALSFISETIESLFITESVFRGCSSSGWGGSHFSKSLQNGTYTHNCYYRSISVNGWGQSFCVSYTTGPQIVLHSSVTMCPYENKGKYSPVTFDEEYYGEMRKSNVSSSDINLQGILWDPMTIVPILSYCTVAANHVNQLFIPRNQKAQIDHINIVSNSQYTTSALFSYGWTTGLVDVAYSFVINNTYQSATDHDLIYEGLTFFGNSFSNFGPFAETLRIHSNSHFESEWTFRSFDTLNGLGDFRKLIHRGLPFRQPFGFVQSQGIIFVSNYFCQGYFMSPIFTEKNVLERLKMFYMAM